MTAEKIDELIDEYEETFGEEPLVVYPSSIYSDVYVHLMKKSLKRGKPYTEDELMKVLDLGEEDVI